MKPNKIYSIENGYFICTVFPTLECPLNCPHCYLSKFQRKNKNFLELENFEKYCIMFKEYYDKKELDNITIIFYWYGGEPTVLGPEYYKKAKDITDKIFNNKKYNIKHELLTSLMILDIEKWKNVIKEVFNNHVETSYDYLMRGRNYLDKWKNKINNIVDKIPDISISAINVVNQTMINKEEEVYNDIKEVPNIVQLGFLPFMKNTTNMSFFGENYIENHATMNDFSNFLINFTNIVLKNDFDYETMSFKKFVIGNFNRTLSYYINNQLTNDNYINKWNNVAGQTLFLLSNGELVLPDYYDEYFSRKDYQFKFGIIEKDYKNKKFKIHGKVENYVIELLNKRFDCIDNGVEYLNSFGSLEEENFEEILKGNKRKCYLFKQFSRNLNKNCLECSYQDICMMEFWKTDNLDCSGECPGGKTYIDFVINWYNNLSDIQKKKIKAKIYYNFYLN